MRAYGYIARQNGRGVWLYKLCHRISDFFSSATKTLRQQGLEALCEGKLTFGLWSEKSGLSVLPARHMGATCASTLRQQVCGVIHKSPGRPSLEATLHAGERPSCVGPEQSALTEGDACAWRDEPWSRHVKEQRLLRGMDTPPARGSENLGSLWQSSSRPLRLRRQLSLSNLFHKEHWCPGPLVAQSSTLCFPSNSSATAALWPIPLRWDLLSQVNGTIWHPRPELCMCAARRDPFGLLERVLNTMAEARALSTRGLYALKWSVFSSWIRSPPMCQWFSHFCRRCWINGAPHPPSTFTR